MKKAYTILLVLGITLLLIGGNAQAAKKEIVNIGLLTAPFGTGGYILGTALDTISKRYHPWLRINSSETPGLVFNAKKLDKEPKLKENTIICFTKGIDYLAKNGLKPFDKKYPSPMFISNYFLISVWMASLDSSIQTKEDLVGKKIAFGRRAQIAWAIAPDAIIRHGWGIRDKVKVQYVGTTPAMKALLDGLVDACAVGGYSNPITGFFIASPQTTELIASGKPLFHISWGEDAIKKTVEKGLPIVPATLPPNSIKGLKKPISVFLDPAAWCAYPEFPEEIAYEITKLIIDNVSKFKEQHNTGNLMSSESLAYGLDPNAIHPGAKRAYKEAGILK